MTRPVTNVACSSKPIPQEMGVPDGSPSMVRLKRLVSSTLFFRHFYLILRQAVSAARLYRQHFYDFNRVLQHSSAVSYGDNKEKLRALLTMAYHSLEKGMSLSKPRPGFGQAHARTVVSRLDRYLTYVGPDEFAKVTLNVLCAYLEFNRQNGVPLPWLEVNIQELMTRMGVSSSGPVTGGVKLMTKLDFLSAAKTDLARFFQSRSSVRQYTSEPVLVEVLERAVQMAQKSPSVCNRQSSRVWILNKNQDVNDALAIQGGARGFADEVGTVLIITSDLAAFQSAGERYQCWIDGGLFAMSLIYALHSLGLATCCLNWSKTRETDLKLKNRFGIPAAESVIMLLSVGHPPEEFHVAQSWRRPLSDVIRYPFSHS